MSEKKNIVVVGAGFSGIFAAKKLAKKFKHSKDHQIVLIDKHSFMTYMTELHEVATDRVEASHIQEDLEMLFHKSRNVKLVTAEVKKVDTKNKKIKTTVGDLDFEYLVIATGGESNDFGTPGVKKFGFELWSFEQAIILRNHIKDVVMRASLELDPVKREELLTIAVVGSGFTGVELIGELIEYRDVIAKETKIDPADIKLVLLEAAPTILNMLTDRNLADKAQEYMENHGVKLRKNAQVTEVKSNHVVFKDGSTLPTSSLVWTAGVKNKSMLEKWGVEYQAGRGGRVQVDEYMRVIGNEEIYAAGDAVEWVDPTAGPTPQTVQGGESMVGAAVKNIYASVKGQPLSKFKRTDWGYAVSIGSHYTVAALFGRFNFGGFFANLVKHGINLYYFLQIASMGSIIKYLNDEIFRMRNGREPFFGMMSHMGNTLWSLGLRIVLGFAFMNAGVGNSFGVPTFTDNPIFQFVNIIIGVAILAGLFTAPFAGLAFLLTLVFDFMHGFSFVSAITIFGSLALMNGVGHTFGLDHFVLPLAKKLWFSIWYGKEKTVYNDLDLNK